MDGGRIHYGYTFHQTVNMKDAGFRVRLDQELRARFVRACKKKDVPGAQVVREFMRSYVEKVESESNSTQVSVGNRRRSSSAVEK